MSTTETGREPATQYSYISGRRSRAVPQRKIVGIKFAAGSLITPGISSSFHV